MRYLGHLLLLCTLASAQQASTRLNDKDQLTYVRIPPGTFVMGCSAGDSHCYRDEKPPRQVTIRNAFWIGQTEVTERAFARVMNRDPSRFKGSDLPVEQVTPDEAAAYCAAIGGRLPSEQEWEYAARAGNASPVYGDLDQVAWYGGNSGMKPHQVGQKQPNGWNLYDMLGNVWEWTGSDGTSRGGAWNSNQDAVRVSNRDGDASGLRNDSIGFRCVTP